LTPGEPLPRRDLYVQIEHRYGSFEHFYHFLIGFFVPLVKFMYVDGAANRWDEVLVRSCGPMDSFLDELRSPILRALPKAEHKSLASRFPDDRRVTLHGLDFPDDYDAATFRVVSAAVKALLADRLAYEADRTARFLGSPWPRVLLIERMPAPPFYSSVESEMKTAGAERRSLGNQWALEKWLAAEFGNCLNVSLEYTTLARQVALFSAADVIVAQHGAALGNLIWARPGTYVVEICPRRGSGDEATEAVAQWVESGNPMGCLAMCMNLRYTRVGQSGLHGDADLEELGSVIRRDLREVV